MATTQAKTTSTTDATTNPIAVVTNAAKDAVYLGVGFGVLTVQKLQVRRQELSKHFGGQFAKQFDGQVAACRERFADAAKTVEARVATVEHRVDAALDEVQSRLPGQAAELLANVRSAARKVVPPMAAAR